jgi:hypothetical protein
MVSLLGLSAPAGATFIEVGDAGDSTGTAVSVYGAKRIEGALNANPFGPDAFDLVDLFRIKIGQPSKFMASTGDGSDAFLIADPVLYLFDSAGRAVAMNDDADGSQSMLMGLPAGLGSGFYFLGISFAVRRVRRRQRAQRQRARWLAGRPADPELRHSGLVCHRPRGRPRARQPRAARTGIARRRGQPPQVHRQRLIARGIHPCPSTP